MICGIYFGVKELENNADKIDEPNIDEPNIDEPNIDDWVIIDDGINCIDNNCDKNAICISRPGAYQCACKSGYYGDGFTCKDIHECAAGEHDCNSNAACINTDGSYTCNCNIGYYGDGVACADIDECADGNPCGQGLLVLARRYSTWKAPILINNKG